MKATLLLALALLSSACTTTHRLQAGDVLVLEDRRSIISVNDRGTIQRVLR